MGNYLAFVVQALRTFAGGVTPGREAVLITPFEEESLLPDWSDQPYVLQNAVRAYAIGDGSSSAETALIDASTALSAREGARAILLVTDAETTSYERTPGALVGARVRPAAHLRGPRRRHDPEP